MWGCLGATEAMRLRRWDGCLFGSFAFMLMILPVSSPLFFRWSALLPFTGVMAFMSVLLSGGSVDHYTPLHAICMLGGTFIAVTLWLPRGIVGLAEPVLAGLARWRSRGADDEESSG